MFGIYRYLLAVAVMVAHVAPREWSWGGSKFMGMYVLFSFYALSGYLMTSILQSRYPYSPTGLWRFAVNRLLRIFPAYWATAAFALVVAMALPDESRRAAPNFAVPTSGGDWLRAAIIAGTQLLPPYNLLVPQIWSLSVELFYYGLMALVLSRHRIIASIWLLLSVIGTYWFMYVKGASLWYVGYLSHAAGSLPFSVGAAISAWRYSIARVVRGWQLPLAVVAFLANLIVSRGFLGPDFRTGFYLSIFLGGWVLACLARFDASRAPVWLRKIDENLGKFSYPLYLCHLAFAAIALRIEPRLPVVGTLGVFLFTAMASHMFSWVIIQLVDAPIERIRARLRPPPN